MKKLILFLMGPTGSGKTQLAIKLRDYLPIELISVDSALIYKGMNIGTSKPTDAQLLKHPHKLINLKDPIETYSAVEFKYDALIAIEEILNKGKIPLLVGGTMFYYHILLHGISNNLPKYSLILRKKFLIYKINNCVYLLHKYLSILDINRAKTIHYNDFHKIVRALEICLITGKNSATCSVNTMNNFLYHVIQFGIFPNKNNLHDKIKNRFYCMLQNGLEYEVRKLFSRADLNYFLPSMRCIGYRQMWLYLNNYISYHDMVYKSVIATNILCKKQMTWLKNWNDLYVLFERNTSFLVTEILNILFSKCRDIV